MDSPPGVSPTAWRALLLAAVAGVSAWLPFAVGSLGDYPRDAAHAIDALAAGHLGDFLSAHPDMGAVSILLRAPAVALSGAANLVAYQWGAIPCLLAGGLLGLYLAQLAAKRDAGWIAQAAIVGICLLNPLTFDALETGHPEEVFTAALAVGAVAVASQGHRGRATLLLGLAIASKQWAVIAVLPVLMALPAGRLRAALGAAGIAAALTLPFLLANPDGFLVTHRSLAFETQGVTHWSAWYPLTNPTRAWDPDVQATINAYLASPLVARVSHPAIILVAVLLPLGLAKRRKSFHLPGADAMALLALLGLLRCVLDPVNTLYYHEPFLLALVGWDALSSRGLPIRALAAAAGFDLLSRWLLTSDVHLFNALYLWLAAIAAAAIAVELFRRPSPQAHAEGLGLGAPRGLMAQAPPARP
jgi:hypothetical protein